MQFRSEVHRARDRPRSHGGHGEHWHRSGNAQGSPRSGEHQPRHPIRPICRGDPRTRGDSPGSTSDIHSEARCSLRPRGWSHTGDWSQHLAQLAGRPLGENNAMRDENDFLKRKQMEGSACGTEADLRRYVRAAVHDVHSIRLGLADAVDAAHYPGARADDPSLYPADRTERALFDDSMGSERGRTSPRRPLKPCDTRYACSNPQPPRCA